LNENLYEKKGKISTLKITHDNKITKCVYGKGYDSENLYEDKVVFKMEDEDKKIFKNIKNETDKNIKKSMLIDTSLGIGLGKGLASTLKSTNKLIDLGKKNIKKEKEMSKKEINKEIKEKMKKIKEYDYKIIEENRLRVIGVISLIDMKFKDGYVECIYGKYMEENILNHLEKGVQLELNDDLFYRIKDKNGKYFRELKKIIITQLSKESMVDKAIAFGLAEGLKIIFKKQNNIEKIGDEK